MEDLVFILHVFLIGVIAVAVVMYYINKKLIEMGRVKKHCPTKQKLDMYKAYNTGLADALLLMNGCDASFDKFYENFLENENNNK